MVEALVWTLLKALDYYIMVVIANVVFSWLYAFNVVNMRNRLINMIGTFLYYATEPFLRPIRNVLPNLGPIDISPLVLMFIIWFIQKAVVNIYLGIWF